MAETKIEWRCDLIELIAETPHLDWLLLTKRIGNAHQMHGNELQTLYFNIDGQVMFELR